MKIPVLDIDLFSPEVMADPFPTYRAVRDMAPICEMPEHDLYVMGRHADVRAALNNWTDFSSSDGVAMNDICNGFMRGTAIASDPPTHSYFRELLARPLEPKRLSKLRARLSELAVERVRARVGVGVFDAMEDLAQLLPLRVISELVGLPEDGRQRMLKWADAGFNAMGPSNNDHTAYALPIMGEMVHYICDPDLPTRFREGSWSAELWDCVERGDLSAEAARSILQGYVTPSLDTTIFALGSCLWLLAHNPEQWRILKDNPRLVSRCINEVLRIEGPARGFSRVARRDIAFEDYVLPAGARVMTLLPSANRDERRYDDPDRFDISRDASDHVAFGAGIHRCVGGNLAMMELSVMLEAIVREVTEIRPGEARLADNAVLRGFEQLKISLH